MARVLRLFPAQGGKHRAVYVSARAICLVEGDLRTGQSSAAFAGTTGSRTTQEIPEAGGPGLRAIALLSITDRRTIDRPGSLPSRRLSRAHQAACRREFRPDVDGSSLVAGADRRIPATIPRPRRTVRRTVSR